MLKPKSTAKLFKVLGVVTLSQSIFVVLTTKRLVTLTIGRIKDS